MATIRSALAHAVVQFRHSASPKLDAETLLASALHTSRSHLFAWPEQALSHEQAALFSALIERRNRGEPIAHILGKREFWSMLLYVTPDTLIPRPETELLVECALCLIAPDGKSEVLDLGTGTGAVALAIASERLHSHITACDQSCAALEVAQRNAKTHTIENITFVQSDWFGALHSRRYDLIVSNPPYVKLDDPHLTQGDIVFEPRAALVSGSDGLDDIRLIIGAANAHLKCDAWVAVEHGHDQGQAVRHIFAQHKFRDIQTLADLAGHDRVCAAKAPARQGDSDSCQRGG